jgi:hypothetical protein
MQGCTSERLRFQSLLVFYDRFYGLSLFIVFSDEWPNDSNHASSLGTKLPLVRGSTWISTKFDMKIGKSRHSINRMPSHAAAAEAAPCLTLWFTLYISRAAELPAAAEGFHVKKAGGSNKNHGLTNDKRVLITFYDILWPYNSYNDDHRCSIMYY